MIWRIYLTGTIISHVFGHQLRMMEMKDESNQMKDLLR